MTKTFAAIFAAVALSFASTAVAAAPEAPITLPAKPGTVTFSHKVHAAQKCTACHKTDAGGDIEGIGKVTRERGVLLHCDAVQGVGRVPFDVERFNVDLASLSAHKMYGPKGVGALYVRRRNPRVLLSPIIDGGGHERGMRSGTLNVAGIVGFAAAMRLAYEAPIHLAGLRDRLIAGLIALDGVTLTGHPTDRLPNSASVVIDGIEGGDLVAALDLEGIETSTGSACTTGSVEPSHVLLAMGIDAQVAHGSLRLTLGRETTETDVDRTLVRAARSFGATRRDQFFKVILPASLSAVMVGVRLGLSRAVLGVVVAEMYVSHAGIGFQIMRLGSAFRVDELLFYVLLVSFFGLAATTAARKIEERISR